MASEYRVGDRVRMNEHCPAGASWAAAPGMVGILREHHDPSNDNWTVAFPDGRTSPVWSGFFELHSPASTPAPAIVQRAIAHEAQAQARQGEHWAIDPAWSQERIRLELSCALADAESLRASLRSTLEEARGLRSERDALQQAAGNNERAGDICADRDRLKHENAWLKEDVRRLTRDLELARRGRK